MLRANNTVYATGEDLQWLAKLRSMMRVQVLHRNGGWRSYTIVKPDGTVHNRADRFLQRFDGSDTQRTYAYHLVDHLRWCERRAWTCTRSPWVICAATWAARSARRPQAHTDRRGERAAMATARCRPRLRA
jgi:hypothetical protein